MDQNVLISFLLTLLVGLTMGLGSLFSFLIKDGNKKFLSLALSFSAGIMIYLSFMEILPEGMHLIGESIPGTKGNIIVLASFFGGMIFIAFLEKIVHTMGGHHHPHLNESHDHKHDDHAHSHDHNSAEEHLDKGHLEKLAIMTAISIGIHNLPEGLAIFTAGLKDITIAIPLAVAVILHNIPLSIAISVPIYYSTKSRKKTFIYSTLVGLCQPLGAIIGYALFSNFFSDMLFGILFAIIAGIMVFISLDELLPASQQYEDHHYSVYGTILGMIVMAVSLMFFGHSH